MILTESKLRLVIKEELKKLLREFNTDWIYTYDCEDLPDALNNIDERGYAGEEKNFMIKAINSRIESCNSPSEDY
jgi:hypothetical protein